MLRSSHVHNFRIGAVVAAVVLTAVQAQADPETLSDLRPAETDLREYLRCSAEAAQRLLGHDEAKACATAYMKVKLSFLPDVSLDEFNRLAPRQKAALNLVAYERYMQWSSRNAAELMALGGAPLSAPTLAAR